MSRITVIRKIAASVERVFQTVSNIEGFSAAVPDTFGTVWDSVFTVKPDGDGTALELTMDARPYKLIPRILNPLMKGGMTKALARDLEAVKVHCEK